MSGELTVEKIIEQLTPKDAVTYTDRISKQDYNVRRDLIQNRLTHTLAVLKANHWSKLVEFFNTVTNSNTPIIFLTKVRKYSGDDRTADVLYSYMLDIYVYVCFLRVLDNRVEDSIEYDEPVYEY